MQPHEIQLTINVGSWRLFTLRKNDPNFQQFSERVFSRDNHTCRFCSFQAKAYQEVINLDRNFRNNKINNLATACCFCAQCFFLRSAKTWIFTLVRNRCFDILRKLKRQPEGISADDVFAETELELSVDPEQQQASEIQIANIQQYLHQ